jgi:transglutaminase-like putative cysteine protease
MRLKISHITEYHYDEPVEFALQRLRLTPKNAPGQKVLSWQSAISGAGVEAAYDDHFGNRVELLSISGGVQSIRIMAQGEVETEDRSGVFGPHLGFVPLWLFLRDTPLTKPGKLTRELARSLSGDGELAKMHELMDRIHEAVEYKTGATTAETTAEQALELKSGVCQDHSHIFISVARLLGLPARYVAGYMLAGEDTSPAAHAWAEVNLPGLGWVGFDCSNLQCPDDRYVRVATGLDYSDAAPISGMRTGDAIESMNVQVMVEQQ